MWSCCRQTEMTDTRHHDFVSNHQINMKFQLSFPFGPNVWTGLWPSGRRKAWRAVGIGGKDDHRAWCAKSCEWLLSLIETVSTLFKHGLKSCTQLEWRRLEWNLPESERLGLEGRNLFFRQVLDLWINSLNQAIVRYCFCCWYMRLLLELLGFTLSRLSKCCAKSWSAKSRGARKWLLLKRLLLIEKRRGLWSIILLHELLLSINQVWVLTHVHLTKGWTAESWSGWLELAVNQLMIAGTELWLLSKLLLGLLLTDLIESIFETESAQRWGHLILLILQVLLPSFSNWIILLLLIIRSVLILVLLLVLIAAIVLVLTIITLASRVTFDVLEGLRKAEFILSDSRLSILLRLLSPSILVVCLLASSTSAPDMFVEASVSEFTGSLLIESTNGHICGPKSGKSDRRLLSTAVTEANPRWQQTAD